MTGIMDAVDGSFAFQVKMRSFSFAKALMQEHFNEDYIESDQFPKASFQGQIVGWSVSLGDGETHVVRAEGVFWCHGIEQRRTIEGSLKKLTMAGKFHVDFLWSWKSMTSTCLAGPLI